MKKTGYLLSIALALLFTLSCEDEDVHNKTKIIGTGPVVSETLDLNPFTGIENTGVADFNVVAGSTQSVVLKAQQNIIDVMTWKVENGSLVVGLDKYVSIEKDADITFEITIPAISDITLTGVGDFNLSGDDQDILNIRLTGVGNVNAYGLKVKNCYVTFTGVGDCKVNVTDNLDVTITGVGYIYYKGDPDINSLITGVGLLINDN
ncbi:MAG TPA: DUF2807 domain-containing protein [Bacteroidales bacterium]|nr:DUF2807 domain-containing protein [Bacteroidales bacterium]